MDQQLFGVGGAGEPADGIAGQAQFGRDRADAVSLGQQPVDRRIALAGPLSNAPASRRGRGRRDRRLGVIGPAFWLFTCHGRDGHAQAPAVPGNGSLGSFAEVVP
jgi:hypothetical protein